jgi:hypothetical protein
VFVCRCFLLLCNISQIVTGVPYSESPRTKNAKCTNSYPNRTQFELFQTSSKFSLTWVGVACPLGALKHCKTVGDACPQGAFKHRILCPRPGLFYNLFPAAMYRMLILNMTIIILNMRMKQLRSATPGCQDHVQKPSPIIGFLSIISKTPSNS